MRGPGSETPIGASGILSCVFTSLHNVDKTVNQTDGNSCVLLPWAVDQAVGEHSSEHVGGREQEQVVGTPWGPVAS